MIEKNADTIIAISIIIILFTEIIGINMQIAFNYLPILFAIITVILFNVKLKEELIDKKKIIIINVIIIAIN